MKLSLLKHSSTLSLLTCSLLVLHISATAQETRPGAPAKANSSPVYRQVNTEEMIEEKLVTLALQGPKYEISDHQNKIAEKSLLATKRNWLNLLTISGNYNDQTFAKQNPNTAYVYPKFFFGINIPLGLIFGLGPQIKIAREQVAVSHSTQEQLARDIRSDVLSKYHQYKMYSSLIALQNQIVLDEQAALAQTEKRFKDGAITIEIYNIANKSFSDDVAKKLNLQLQQDLIKIQLENIIGTRLETAIN